MATNRGRYDEMYPDEKFVDAIEAEGGEATSGTVAGRVGCSRRTATRRLAKLADAGEIDRRDVANATLWSTPDE